MKRKGIIISVIGIIIVALSLLGITFGYYYTQIFGNENATSVKVTSAMKAVKYIELSEEVSGTVIKPGYEYIKTFAATSLSTEEAIYHIYLDDVINEFTRTQDITYTLYRKSGNNTIDTSDLSDCEEISSGIFPKTNSYIKFNEKLLTKGDSYTYALKINYLESTEEQDIDDGKTFGFKVQLHSEFQNPYSDNTSTLAYNIINSAVTKQNGTELIFSSNKFTGISEANEKTLSIAPDDYGTSYYYRGAVKDNYVKFAGFTWRIVRINGDGSIRLILDGTLNKVKREGSDAFAGSTSTFKSSPYIDNAYEGYMYGLAGSTTDTNRCLKLNVTTVEDVVSTYGTKETCEANGGTWTTNAYEATHANIADSTIKTAADTFYETYIENNTNNYHYEKYLADTLFCGDKTLASSSIGSSNTALGYGTNKTYYAATERLYYSTGTTSITTATPTLECAKGASNTYSRYTSNSTTTTKGVSVNNDLKHPIALLSADELVMAGAWRSIANKTYYLYDAYLDGNLNSTWWTMSPSNFNGSSANEFSSNATSGALFNSLVHSSGGSRLAVNLKSDSLIASGDGTKERPYVLKEIN